MGALLVIALHVAPGLLLPAGLIGLFRVRTVAGRAGVVGCALIGAAWIYSGWQYLACDGEPASCGAPSWVDAVAVGALVAGIALALAAALTALMRGRRTPAR